MYVYTVKLTLTVEEISTHALAATVVQDAIAEANSKLKAARFPTRVTIEDINVGKKKDQ